MLIDWFTVGAQVINFLILVAILRFFLYRRVIDAMDRRQLQIDAGFRDAEEREREATEAAAAHQAELEQIRSERQGRISDLEAELAELRRRQLDELADEVAATKARWEGSVAADRAMVLEEIQRAVGSAVSTVAAEALASLADTDLDGRVVDTFLSRLARADSDEHQALRNASGEVAVHTTFPLDDDRRTAIEAAIDEHLGLSGPIAYQIDPDLGCGIELRAGGLALGWSTARYLDGVRREFEELVHQGRSDD